MSTVVYAWPQGKPIEDYRAALEILIGEKHVTDHKVVPIPKPIAAMLGDIFVFQITNEGHRSLKTGIPGPGPFIDWPLQSPFETETSSIELQWEGRVWPPLRSLDDLIGLKLRRIPTDSPTKDLVPDRVTFYVNEEGRITGFDQG